MSKKRTKKQKQNAKHSFSYSWRPTSNEAGRKDIEASVKGQLPIDNARDGSSNSKRETVKNSVDIQDLASTKKQIYRSLILAGLILASEMVIYLVRR